MLGLMNARESGGSLWLDVRRSRLAAGQFRHWSPTRSAALHGAARNSRPVNLSLGLTFYCSGLVRRRRRPDSRRGLAHDASTTRAPPRLRRRSAPPGRRRLLDHDGALARHHRIDRDRRRAAHATPSGGRRCDSWGERYRANPRRSGRGDALCPGAARASASARRPPPCSNRPRSTIRSIPRCARRLWPRARRHRQLPAGARGAQPRPHAGPAGLAHPVGAGRGARPDGPPRGSAALLRQRAADVPDEPSVLSNLGLSYALSKDLPQAEATLRRAARAARRRAAACGRTSRWWSACRAASGGRDDRARRPVARRGRRQRRLSAADAGAAEATGSKSSAARR